MSTELGQRAEQLAGEYISSQGLTVLERNWRNRWCEIDIIARDRHGGIHFVEVKYRKTTAYGSGFEYITGDKVQRLRRSAMMWLSEHRGVVNFQVDAVAVTGDLANPLIEYLPNILE